MRYPFEPACIAPRRETWSAEICVTPRGGMASKIHILMRIGMSQQAEDLAAKASHWKAEAVRAKEPWREMCELLAREYERLARTRGTAPEGSTIHGKSSAAQSEGRASVVSQTTLT